MSEYSSLEESFDEGEVDRHADLISLLSVVQAFDTELITVTWDPGL
jgi:hypothetical protein